MLTFSLIISVSFFLVDNEGTCCMYAFSPNCSKSAKICAASDFHILYQHEYEIHMKYCMYHFPRNTVTCRG